MFSGRKRSRDTNRRGSFTRLLQSLRHLDGYHHIRPRWHRGPGHDLHGFTLLNGAVDGLAGPSLSHKLQLDGAEIGRSADISRKRCKSIHHGAGKTWNVTVAQNIFGKNPTGGHFERRYFRSQCVAVVLHPLPGSMDRSPSSETNHGNVLFGHDNFCDLSVKREKRRTLPRSTYRKNKFCADEQRVQVGKHMGSPLHSIHESPVRLRGVFLLATHTKLHTIGRSRTSQG